MSAAEDKVDVLAVLDDRADSCANRRDEALRAGDEKMAAFWRVEIKQANEARAAVTELIERAQTLSNAITFRIDDPRCELHCKLVDVLARVSPP